MRKLYTILLFLLSILNNAYSQEGNVQKYYHILDAAQGNQLFNALRTDSTPLPLNYIPLTEISEEQLTAFPGSNTLDFTTIETIKVNDTATLSKVMISKLSLENLNLSGTVPAVSLQHLKVLGLHTSIYGNRGYINHIAGINPNIDLPSLERINLDNTGLIHFPALPFPQLTHLYMGNNEGMSGNIPALNFEHLQYAYLSDNNQLTGNLEVNAPQLTRLDAARNQLMGSLDNINAPQLEYLDLSNNQLSGPLEAPALPLLENLFVRGNALDEIPPSFIEKVPALNRFNASLNHFQFDDLLPFADLGLEEFRYNPQSYAEARVEESTDHHILDANVGGATEYQWYFVTPESVLLTYPIERLWRSLEYSIITGTTEENGVIALDNESQAILKIPKEDDPRHYACLTQNNKLPELKIVSVIKEYDGNKCWENDYFSFCLLDEEGQWLSGENESEITSSTPVLINDFLTFEGTLTLDTSTLKVAWNGQLFIESIPLPGGGYGKFILSQGEYDLTLGGSDGLITGFINNALSEYTPNIGGLELELEDLRLVGGKNADGVSMTLQVSWDNITPSCGGDNQKTAIRLSGLKITGPDGISVDGLQVNDLGIAPGFCIKDLNASYQAVTDKLTFGLTVLTPFIEVGGGLGFLEGEIDSIALKAVLQDAIIPLGTTGIGIKGCLGEINHISNPPIGIKLGGVLGSVVNENLFELTTTLEYIPPSTLKVAAGEGKFFNPPFYDDWWQGEGSIYGQLDFSTYRLKLGGDLKFLPYQDNKDKKQFMVSGEAKIGYNESNFGEGVSGQVKGDVLIPALGSNWPFGWLSIDKVLGLPYTFSGDNILVYKTKLKMIRGDLYLGPRIGQVQYYFDLDKRYDEEGFFSFGLESFSLGARTNTREDRNIDVPENTPLTVIKVTGINDQSNVLVTDPGGRRLTKNSPGENAEWLVNTELNNGYWNLYSPQPGSWIVTAENVGEITYYHFPSEIDFMLEAKPQQSGILLTWDATGYTDEDQIDIYIDDDGEGWDGGQILSLDAQVGSHLLPYSGIDNYCEFYLYGMVNHNNLVYSDYADHALINPDIVFLPIENLDWEYNDNSGQLIITWEEVVDNQLAGYTVNMINGEEETVLAMLYPQQNTYEGIIPELDPTKVYVATYGYYGEHSCPAYLKSSTSTEGAMPVNEEKKGIISIYPNPFSDMVTLNLNCSKKGMYNLRMINSMGQITEQYQIQVEKGMNVINLQLDQLLTGQYIIQLIGKDGQESTRIIKI